jgi:hypothetical protein
MMKYNISLNVEPTAIDATAPAAVDFFQYVPKTNGTKHPANTMSNAKTK